MHDFFVYFTQIQPRFFYTRLFSIFPLIFAQKSPLLPQAPPRDIILALQSVQIYIFLHFYQTCTSDCFCVQNTAVGTPNEPLAPRGAQYIIHQSPHDRSGRRMSHRNIMQSVVPRYYSGILCRNIMPSKNGRRSLRDRSLNRHFIAFCGIISKIRLLSLPRPLFR